jgi:glycerate 2-kinase
MTESKLRRNAVSIFKAALKAADPAQAVLRHLAVRDGVLTAGKRRYKLDNFDRVLVLGAGKASAMMAKAVEKVLGKRVSAGLVNVKYGHLAPLKRVELNECGHPVPDEAGVAGAERIAAFAAEAGERDLVICVMSGGGSALLPMPADPITLDQKQATTRLLLECGASIHEINAVRKHISGIKGGQLSRLAWPATVVSLMLSDVIGDDFDVIASGPTASDSSTFASATGLLEHYGIFRKIPAAVRKRLEQGCAGKIADTPKQGAPELARTQNLVVGSNRLAADAAVAQARKLGFKTLVLSTFVEGETKDVARMHAAIAKEILSSGRPLKTPACVITGGETTVTIRGKGLGGRNQEFALAAALDIAGMPGTVILSGGTDGSDGPTDAAGAIADGKTISRATAGGLDPLAYLGNNDSYHFFEPLGDLLKTGPTNTNVMDLRLVLVG